MNQPTAGSANDEMSNEILQRAITSMQDEAVPPGPSAELIAATRHAVQELDQRHPRAPRYFPRTPSMRITAAAAGLLLTVATGIVLSLAVKPPSSAFGQVLKQIRGASSMSYTQFMTVEGQPGEIVTKVFVSPDGRRRSEMPSAGTTTIFDTNGYIRITLLEITKTALVQEPKPDHGINAGRMFLAWLEDLKKLGDKPDKNLGQKEFDGKRATGFVATLGKSSFTIWVDNGTSELARIEYDSLVNGTPAHITMTDFRFDEKLDDSLFDFSVPAGYKIWKSPIAAADPGASSGETNIVEALRGYTKRDGGKFPASLSDWGQWGVLFSKDSRDGGVDPEATRVMSHLGAILPFLMSMPKDSYAYLGEGKTTGEKDAIVFWYRKPDGKYRAIYGDLSVKDTTAADLPK
jgi:outer membrane lipoprotein-sorting protein